MLVLDLTAWRADPATAALLRLCLRQQAPVVGQFLTGQPVDPVQQGRAAAYRELETLLRLPEDKLMQELNKKEG